MRFLLFIVLIGTFCVQAFSQSKLYLPVDSAEYFKMIDIEGQVQTEWKKLEDVTYNYSDGLILGKNYGRWGLLDTNLEFILKPQFHKIYKIRDFIFAETYTSFHIYSENLDTLLIVDDFESVEFSPFFEMSIVGDFVEESKFRMIIRTFDGTVILNTDMKWVTKPVYDDAFFYDNLIFLRKGEKFGFMGWADTIIEPIYTKLGRFNDRIIELEDDEGQRHYFLHNGVMIPDSDSTLVYDKKFKQYKIYQNGKGSLLDYDLNPIIDYEGGDIFCIYKENISLFDTLNEGKTYFAVKQNEKIGVIDEDGDQILPSNFDQVLWGGSQDRFIVMLNDKFGVMNSQNDTVIPPTYTYITAIRGEFFKLYNYKEKGVADLNGNIVVPVEFNELNCHSTGVVTVENGYYGFYTYKGQRVLENIWPKVMSIGNTDKLEFRSDRGRCIPGRHGLITPMYCQKIHLDRNGHLKYYLSDRIVVGNVLDDSLQGITIYPRLNSIVIQGELRRDDYHVSEPDFETFLSQQNGKIGSIHKELDGYAVEPIFFNLFELNGISMGKHQIQENIRIGNMEFTTKEILQPLYGMNGSLGDQFKSCMTPRSFPNWHSSKFDPVLTMDDNYRYYSYNNVYSGSAQLMLIRKGFTSIAISDGEVNFEDGQDVIELRQFFFDTDTYYNLSIDSPGTFSVLSRSPMIKVKDPQWHIIDIKEYEKYEGIGPFDQWQQFPGALAIYGNDNQGLGILLTADSAITEKAGQILPFEREGIQFFKVYVPQEYADGTTSYKWTIFDYSGQILEGTYEGVEMIHPDYFIVWIDDQKKVVNRMGETICLVY